MAGSVVDERGEFTLRISDLADETRIVIRKCCYIACGRVGDGRELAAGVTVNNLVTVGVFDEVQGSIGFNTSKVPLVSRSVKMSFAWVRVPKSPRAGLVAAARLKREQIGVASRVDLDISSRFGHGHERCVRNSQTEDSRCIVLGNGAEVARQLELKADEASDVRRIRAKLAQVGGVVVERAFERAGSAANLRREVGEDRGPGAGGDARRLKLRFQ